MEGSKGFRDRTEPRDAYNAAYMIHFLLGVGNLLPWNALITAVDYFGYLYPDKHVGKVFSVAYMGSSLLVLVLLTCLGSWNRLPGFKVRMNLGFFLFVLVLLTAPVTDWIYHGKKSHKGYGALVLAVSVCGLADGLIGGSLIGAAGEMPPRYMQALFAGTKLECTVDAHTSDSQDIVRTLQARSGVLVSILRIVTKASLPPTPTGLQTSAHFYFIISSFIVLLCIICCNLLDRLPVIQHSQSKRNIVFKTQISNTPDDSRISERNRFNVIDPTERPTVWTVARKIRWAALGILSIYTVTLSIFPGYLTEDVKSKFLRDWYPILLITIYNASDLLGKSLTAIHVPTSTLKATWSCAARLLFYPLFTACLHGPKWLRSELPVVFLTVMLGLTNGYLTSALMILAPKSVPVEEAETAGFVMALFLAIGLVVGSLLGWLWIT